MEAATWVHENNVNALLVIDEAQQAMIDPTHKEATEVLLARSKKFWDSLDESCLDPHFPMTVIIGTGSEVAHLVYDRPRGVRWKMPKDKFRSHWLEY